MKKEDVSKQQKQKHTQVNNDMASSSVWSSAISVKLHTFSPAL